MPDDHVDPELAAIFERIARAIPNAADNGVGLPPRVFLNLYAALLEAGESLTVATCYLPTKDPQLD